MLLRFGLLLKLKILVVIKKVLISNFGYNQ